MGRRRYYVLTAPWQECTIRVDGYEAPCMTVSDLARATGCNKDDLFLVVQRKGVHKFAAKPRHGYVLIAHLRVVLTELKWDARRQDMALGQLQEEHGLVANPAGRKASRKRAPEGDDDDGNDEDYEVDAVATPLKRAAPQQQPKLTLRLPVMPVWYDAFLTEASGHTGLSGLMNFLTTEAYDRLRREMVQSVLGPREERLKEIIRKHFEPQVRADLLEELRDDPVVKMRLQHNAAMRLVPPHIPPQPMGDDESVAMLTRAYARK